LLFIPERLVLILLQAKTEKQKEVEEIMGDRLRKKYQAQKAGK
jgi:hypothetical protein